MSSQKQIDANRENSQNSTGPTSSEGLKRSSLNSTVHGFTGQTLVLSAAEKAPYEAFVEQMRAEFRPCTAESRELLQNYTDLRWSIQQITIQQNNILAIMNVITQHHIETDDLAGLDPALEPHTRRLKTLGTYEQRRRRAAKETLALFNEVEQQHHTVQQEQLRKAAEAHEAFKKLGQAWDPKEFGFVCSLPEIEQFLATQQNKELLEMICQEAAKAPASNPGASNPRASEPRASEPRA
jgi:hypothetical protein